MCHKLSWSRPIRAVLLGTVATILQPIVPSFAQTVPVTGAVIDEISTFRAYDFVDSVGMNIHLHSSKGFYSTQFDLMKQRLLAANIKHVRDGALDYKGGFYANDKAQRYVDLGKAGIRVTFIFRPSVSKEFVQGYPARVQPAFGAYELPNELNAQTAVPWVETLRTWMPAFKTIIKSNPATASYPIIGPSLADRGDDPFSTLGSQERDMDFGNIHKYYPGYNPGTIGYGRRGLPPCNAYRYGALNYTLCYAAKVSGAKPIICTESGYGSNPTLARQVTPSVQAKYISRLLMLYLKAGIRRTFIYQLADYGSDGFFDYGLLTQTGEEKPAFTQLRGLMNEMKDQSSTGKASELPITVTGETGGVESALFAKSDGSYRLVLWLEKPSYDPNANAGAGAVVTPPTQNVIVNFPESRQVRRILRFDETGAGIDRAGPVATPLPVTVSDNLTILDLSPSTARPRAPVIHTPM